MYTKTVPENKQPSATMDTSEILSKDLENQLILKGCNKEEESSISISHNGCIHRPTSDCNEDNNHAMKCAKNPKWKMGEVPSIDLSIELEDEAMEPPKNLNQRRRSTLTVTDLPLRPALLPLAEPNNLADSPTTEVIISQINLPVQTSVPSRVLLEERVVEIPEDRFGLFSTSRRESAQSCISDYQGSDCGRVRFVRTPSVVVSDYSDDLMCGITLEEIEYLRAQRLQRRFSMETSNAEKDEGTSEVSTSSSCSDLYYGGSTISAIDGAECLANEIRKPIENKLTNTSTYGI